MKHPHSNKSKRSKHGNMTLFAILGFGILAVLILIGASFSTVLFVQSQLQRFTDDVALAGAMQLNDADRIGQFNNLEVRCRQLVYTSRLNTELTGRTGPDVQQLAADLLDEDRANAKALELERARLQALVMKEAKLAITNEFNRQSEIFKLALPWLKVEMPKLQSVEFGTIADVASNATFLTSIDDLAEFDRKKKIVQIPSQLYAGNINAKLPGDDGDLDFRISSLIAPVQGKIAGARLVSARVFQPVADSHLPSAVRISISANMSPAAMSGMASSANTLNLTSCATTTGASPVW